VRWRFLCFPVSAGLISARVNAVDRLGCLWGRTLAQVDEAYCCLLEFSARRN
jgi:hypothetical protein